ncbi:YihY/virulence factor BrkB family protein [Flavobacterium sp.]|uniref:YihY/virulence factor BrkB family protein n=1 Tax=Flavobacterium sp. TaxID=239 RepID=UPI0025C36EED|nr:YihY/virulence factor BrkB family protein [Flavobacterium sp.]
MKGVKEAYYKDLWDVIHSTFSEFGEHKIMKKSASLAYTTVFSMAPLLMVLLYVVGLFWGTNAIEGEIFYQIKDFLGEKAAIQLQEMIKNIAISNKSGFPALIGIVTLLIGATSVFAEIQDSINSIWGIRLKKRSSFWLYFKSRLLSFGVIGSLGFILLASLGLSAILDSLNQKLFAHFSEAAVYTVYIGQTLVTLTVITLLFAVIFKILPDANITWKQVRVSSITTALLFMFGKFLISFYISQSSLGTIYGAAGSLVIIMVWVYYSSVILYLGALFAKCYAIEFGSSIKPSKYAEIIHVVELKLEATTLQDAKEEVEEFKLKNDIE